MNVSLKILALAVLTSTVSCASMSDDYNATPPSSSTPTTVVTSAPGVIPVGQQLDVRLQERLSSETARPEERFETTTLVDLRQDGDVLVPAGSVIRGHVSSADAAGKIDRSGRLTLAFDQLTMRGRTYEIRAMATQAFESRGVLDEGRTVGAAGAVGAIVGGIIGGLRGAVVGAAVGAGGVIAATEGKDVVLPAGTVLRLRFDSPIRVR